MPPIRVSVSAQNVHQYRQLARTLRETGQTDLRKKLRQAINDAGRPVLDEVKERVSTLHVTSSRGGGGMQRARFKASRARTVKARDRLLRKGRGLRSEISSATKLQITTKGVRFYVNSQLLPADQQSLPRHLDSPTGWRHPVFGNKSNWVSQKGGPWFADTIKKRAPSFRQAIVKAMDDVAKELES